MASPETQLAIRQPVKITRPTKTDRTCWFLFRQHISIDEIATRLRRSVPAVQHSIERMQIYQSLTSNEEVNMRYNEVVLANIDQVGKVIHDGLRAVNVTREVTEDPKTGKKRTRVVARDPDHPTRYKAAEMLQKAADRALPKGAGVQVNVQQNNAGVDAPIGRSFEERLRQRREAQGLSNAVVIDAGAIDPGDRDESGDDFEEDDGEE